MNHLRDLRFVVFVSCVVPYVLVLSTAARAQDRYEAGAQAVVARSSQFDTTDVEIGGRFSWQPVNLIGAEAEMSYYPRPSRSTSGLAHSRLEGLFGFTVGPRIGRVRPFAKLRPGFLIFRRQPVACILIFPPPLNCQLATGHRSFVLDAGGGIELFSTARTFIRADAGDRLIRYPGPSFRNGRVTQDAFFSHDFRISAGVGLTF